MENFFKKIVLIVIHLTIFQYTKCEHIKLLRLIKITDIRL